MKKQKVKEVKIENKGITLIALVITIIVLLILAAITISSLMGDNSIIGKANEAVIQTNLGTVRDAYNLYRTENYEKNKEDFTKLLKKVPVGEEGEYVYVIQDLNELKLDNLGEYGIGEIPESVSAITEFNNLYIVDESNNVSYVLEGKIYGTVELAKDTEPEESEEDIDLTKFFTFNEETGAITGIVENTTKDANGIGWYYDGDDPETANKIFSYKKDTLTIPKTINGKAVTSITQRGGVDRNDEEPDSDFSGNTETTIHLIIPEGITSIDGGAFANCQWINEVTLPSTIERIEDETFQNCKNLKKINFDENNKINYIGEHAFCKTGIEEIILPEEVTTVDRYAFERSKLQNYEFKADNVDFIYATFQYCKDITTVNLPFNQKKIAQGMFYNSGIKTLKLSSSINSVGAGAFWGCSLLESADLSETSIRTLGYSTFEGDKSLKTVILPESLERIDVSCFGGCTNLSIINLNEGLQTIGDGAFEECSSLAKINVPSTVVEIGSVAFGWCQNIQEIRIPASVQTMDMSVFFGCDNLKKIILKEGTTLQVPEDKWGATNAAIEYEP